MSEIKHTPGPYERNGTTVYALQHHGWRKGEEQFCNRIYANVYAGPRCEPEEVEAVARLFQASPDLFEALFAMNVMWESICDLNGWDPAHNAQYTSAVSAILKATGA